MNDFRFGYMRYRVNVLPGDIGTSPAKDAGIPGLNLDPYFIAGETLAAALDALDPAVRAGLEMAIANVRAVAEADLGDDVEVALAAGPDASRCATSRSAAPRSTSPAAGRRTRARSSWASSPRAPPASSEVVVCAPGAHPRDPRRVRALRRRRRVLDGRRPRGRRAGLRHRDDRRGPT